MKFLARLFVLCTLVVIFAAGCSATTPGAPPPTNALAPTNAPVAANPAQPTNAANAPTDAPAATSAPAANADSGGLPPNVAAGEGRVYTFQVLPEQTTVEYAVNEILFNNQQTTRGKTNAVQGEFK
ncbi:MAG: hypothetical protein HY741_10885 [Chloroflexi bacterium]|nr:hypothetical protein [Chloroflexota bacterium]